MTSFKKCEKAKRLIFGILILIYFFLITVELSCKEHTTKVTFTAYQIKPLDVTDLYTKPVTHEPLGKHPEHTL